MNLYADGYMKRYVIFFCTLLLAVLPLEAQQIKVENFVQTKRRFLTRQTVKKDKKQAILDFHTNEKGFTFLPNGGNAAAAEEGDGKITLLLPHKTAFLVIQHADYGQLTWKVPDKTLRKKKHYEADLLTSDPKKEYKPGRQWVVFYVRPENALVTVDSTGYSLRNGNLQLLLPVGRHICKLESPFYETYRDTLDLNDSTRLEIRKELQPFYSYLKVNTRIPEGEIRLDGELIGCTNANTKRIMPGRYRLTVTRDNLSYYDEQIEVEAAEKKVLDLTGADLAAGQGKSDFQQQEGDSLYQADVSRQETSDTGSSPKTQASAPIRIKAFDKDTEIWINREPKAKGEWEGVLSTGFYAVSSRKDGLESETFYLWVNDNRPKELNLASPLADYGMLNVSSNEVDATVWLNGIAVGRTPCIIKNLPAGQSYTVRLSKPGYKAIVKEILLRKNDMANLRMEMKK
ncbi:MAG: PEGA domain-containing protein [Prevotella sp.]|jgi:hypothetical protein|nr:PEGA domain-containing protein [Prevotella sp.]